MLFLIEYQIQPLTAIESKTGIARYKRQSLGDGMGNDDVVGRVFVPLRFIDFHTGIHRHVFFFKRKNFDVEFIFDSVYHFFYRLPAFRAEAFIAIGDNQFSHGFRADVQYGIRFFENGSYIIAQGIAVCCRVYEYIRIN